MKLQWVSGDRKMGGGGQCIKVYPGIKLLIKYTYTLIHVNMRVDLFEIDY